MEESRLSMENGFKQTQNGFEVQNLKQFEIQNLKQNELQNQKENEIQNQKQNEIQNLKSSESVRDWQQKAYIDEPYQILKTGRNTHTQSLQSFRERSTPKLGMGSVDSVGGSTLDQNSSRQNLMMPTNIHNEPQRPQIFNSVDYEAREQLIKKSQQLRKNESFRQLCQEEVSTNISVQPISVYQKSSRVTSPSNFEEKQQIQNFAQLSMKSPGISNFDFKNSDFQNGSTLHHFLQNQPKDQESQAAPHTYDFSCQTDTQLASQYPNQHNLDPNLAQNLREQLTHQNKCLSDLQLENRELKYLLKKEQEQKQEKINRHSQDVNDLEEQIKQMKFSVIQYQSKMELMINKHIEALKKQNKEFQIEKQQMVEQHEQNVNQLKLREIQTNGVQKEYIDCLERDKEFNYKLVDALQKEVKDLKESLELTEQRLDRQVVVDQNIEMSLQDEIANLKSEKIQLQKECKAINKENQMFEKENNKLLKENKTIKEQKQNLQKIIYGNGVKPPTKTRY